MERIITADGTLSPNVMSAGTGLNGASTWTSGNVYSYTGEVGLRGFLRVGAWGDGSAASVLYLALNNDPSYTNTGFGLPSNITNLFA